MTWLIKYSEKANKQLKPFDPTVRKRIKKFLEERISPLDNPRSIGEALSGPLGDYWKYRVGDYRIICDIQDNIITILILTIGNRKQVYKR
jgi:mRNA interferase RelE/StbE